MAGFNPMSWLYLLLPGFIAKNWLKSAVTVAPQGFPRVDWAENLGLVLGV